MTLKFDEKNLKKVGIISRKKKEKSMNFMLKSKSIKDISCPLNDLFLFDSFFTSHQQSFSYVGTGIPGLNQY